MNERPYAILSGCGRSNFTPSIGVLQRKCACGGSSGLTGSCSDCEKKKQLGQPLQTKLRINEPSDAYEQEADRVAGQVMRMPEPGNQPNASKTAAAALVQRKVGGSTAGLAPSSIVTDVLSSPGQPLDAQTRAFFEPRFGHDFSQVRVHSDGRAAESAQAVAAHAYTVGEHMGFATGRFNPGTHEGRRLIAHELAHVVQQSRVDGSEAGQASAGLTPSTLSKNLAETCGRVQSPRQVESTHLHRQSDPEAIDRATKFAAILSMLSGAPKTSLASVIPSEAAKVIALEAMRLYRMMTPAERRRAFSSHFASGGIARLFWALPKEIAAQRFPVELNELLRAVEENTAGTESEAKPEAQGADLVVYTGGQSGHLQVIRGGRWIYAGRAVSGHPGHGENEPREGPIPSGRYVMHPGITRTPVTGIEYGVCGANPISYGYQEIPSTHAKPCEGSHYCNVPCPTPDNPEQKCYTPRDCWGSYRIKIEGSKEVVTPEGSRRVRSAFYLHGGNPADAVSSGCVKSLDDGIFAKIRTLTGVKGAVPFCVGESCKDKVDKAVAGSFLEGLRTSSHYARERH